MPEQPAERAAARNERDVTVHVALVKADDRTSLPRTAKDKLLQPSSGRPGSAPQCCVRLLRLFLRSRLRYQAHCPDAGDRGTLIVE